jgi:hypothetical protein
LTAQRTLPHTIRTTFEETIRPDLITVLRECLPPMPTADPNIIRETIVAKLSEHHSLIAAAMEEIKQQIKRPQLIQRQIQSLLSFENGSHRQNALADRQELGGLAKQPQTKSHDQDARQKIVPTASRMPREILSEM